MRKIIKIGLIIGIAIAFLTPVSMVFADPYTLTLTTSGTGAGTIETNSSGPFNYGDVIRIWANASTGSTFVGFSGSLSGTGTPQDLTFDDNESVDAAFTLNGPYTLTLTTSGTGAGTIEANASGPFYYGDVVRIWANASVGSTFAGFTGSLTGSTTPQDLTFDGNETVNAAYTLSAYTLTLTMSGTGDGTIEANASGPFYYGDVVRIWANVSIGSTFTGFTGSLTGTTTPQDLTFDGNETVNAAYTLSAYTLTLTMSGTGSGTIEANSSGPFNYGDVVRIWANASVGSTFTGFTGSLTGMTTPQDLIFDGNESVDAAFTLNGPYTLTLTTSGTGVGTIEANASGPFYYGDVVRIWANASTGSTFAGFAGSLTGIITPQDLTFDGNESVDAAFTLNVYTLTLTTSGTGAGTVEANASGPFYYGDVVRIWANASTGSTFAGFTGSLSGTGTPQDLTFDGNESVDAAYTLSAYTLTLTMSGTGSGTIEANSSGPFNYGDIVRIWANASVGSTFVGFAGSLSGTGTPQDLTFDGNESVDAAFILNGPYTLTLTTSGTGSGTIEANSSGPFYYGDVVKIWANASGGSIFTGFTGSLTGFTTPQDLTFDGNESVDAAYTLSAYTLTLTMSGTGSGTIEANSSGPFNYGDIVRIWANASVGSTFTGFTGSLTGTTTPQDLTFDGNESVDAAFIFNGPYTLTLTTSGTGSGTIEVNSSGPFYLGDVVRIWANASNGSTFTGFTGSLSGTTSPQDLTFDGNESVDAAFTLNGPYTLTLTTSGTGSGTIEVNSSGPFYLGDVVRIWANASNGSTFTGFTGNLSGTGTPQNLTFDGNESVDAAFTLNGPYTLTLTTSGTGAGTIQANSSGPFYLGDVVRIWANASNGSYFTGFTGNLSGTGTPQNLTFDGNESVNAVFTLYTTELLQISGPSTGGNGILLNFTVNATDPTETQIYYKWDWGDGNVSDWLGPFNSSTPAIRSYAWANDGNYSIRVKAMYIGGGESNWSQIHRISIAEQVNFSNMKIGMFYIKFLSYNKSFLYSDFLKYFGVVVILSSHELYVKANTTDIVKSVTFKAINQLAVEDMIIVDDNGSDGFSCNMNVSRGVYELTVIAYDINGTLVDKQTLSTVFFIRIGRYATGSSRALEHMLSSHRHRLR